MNTLKEDKKMPLHIKKNISLHEKKTLGYMKTLKEGKRKKKRIASLHEKTSKEKIEIKKNCFSR